MQRPNQQQSLRIDVANLKGEVVKRIGLEKSRKYFHYLSMLLTQKFRKNEFDKLCTQVIGKKNLTLHNLLIRSILKNACHSKVPLLVRDGYKQNGYAGLAHKKSKSSIRKNQPGFVNGKLENASENSNGQFIIENGEASPSERPRESHGLLKDIKVDLCKNGLSSDSDPLRAPFGIPFCRYGIGGSRKRVPTAGFSNISNCCSRSGNLPDSQTLQKCMEQIAVAQGFEGVSMECANILNSGLDAYLKRLITSCVSLVGGKAGIGIVKQSKLLNGLMPSNYHYLQNNGGHIETFQESRPFSSMSMLDFEVAMEINPQKLGENWPLLLEKMSMDQFND